MIKMWKTNECQISLKNIIVNSYAYLTFSDSISTKICHSMATSLHIDARKIFISRLWIQSLASRTHHEEKLANRSYGHCLQIQIWRPWWNFRYGIFLLRVFLEIKIVHYWIFRSIPSHCSKIVVQTKLPNLSLTYVYFMKLKELNFHVGYTI